MSIISSAHRGRHHIFLGPGQPTVTTITQPVVVFHLNGFDFYYEEDNKTYWAIESNKTNAVVTINNQNPRPLKLDYSSFYQIKKHSVFAFNSEFELVMAPKNPMEIHLLAIKRMIQIHQVMGL
jgi:hypothetical protein